MEAKTAIEIIQESKFMTDVLRLMNNQDSKVVYTSLAKILHPDVCTVIGASQAMSRLNVLRDEYENGKSYYDQAGEYKHHGYSIKRTVVQETEEEKLLISSMVNRVLISRMGMLHLNKYMIDESFLKESYRKEDGGMKYTFLLGDKRSVPLCDIDKLEEKHVVWILSRMLEFTMMLNGHTKGFVHCGISPDTIFVVPENHGIIVTSFFNTTRVDKRVNTIDNKYKNWYPKQLFDYKTAHSMIDIELAKRTACWLLGDKIGMGTTLHGKINPELLSFLLRSHKNPYECFVEYREMVDKNFEKKFHILNL